MARRQAIIGRWAASPLIHLSTGYVDNGAGYLLAVGSRFGAEALGLPPPPDVELDLSHPSLAGVAERDAAAALIFGGSAAALRPTEDR